MRDLIAVMEAAEAGSRELDDWVVIAAFDGEMMDWWDDDAQQHQIKAGDGSRVNVTPVTTSLDAAIALAERVLPVGLTWRVEKDFTFTAAIWDDPEYEAVGSGRSKTPALALCIAILKAKMETEK